MTDVITGAAAGVSVSASEVVLSASKLSKRYDSGPASTDVLNNVSLEISRGETLAIVGASGSGKSTLLHLLGGLDQPTSGDVAVLRQPLRGMADAERSTLRNTALGFVYQFHHLLAELTALDNVALALRVRRVAPAAARAEARAVLESVGLGPRTHHLPSELSGGERQRVAIARALVTRPACVLADEPTGNLDEGNSERVFDLLLAQVRTRDAALILVTHDQALAARCDRVMTLHLGELVTVTQNAPASTADIGNS
jgi:lipoprotein-releasing system ATP-binding protein